MRCLFYVLYDKIKLISYLEEHMISTQIIKNCLEELHIITKVDFAIYGVEGIEIYNTLENSDIQKSVILGFIDSPADSQVVGNCHLLKLYDEEELIYVIASLGEDDMAHMAGKIAVSQIKMLLQAYKEKFDRNNFIQNLLMDNMLLVDVYSRAKKLRIETDIRRVVFIVESGKEREAGVSELLKNMFTVQNGDFVAEIDEKNDIVVKALSPTDDEDDIKLIAQSIVDTVGAEAMVDVRVGYGTVVSEIKDVSKSYKEAMMAIDVGKIFYANRKVNAYNSLGIGRLIYQLPSSLCQMFIEEIFGDNDPANFDDEIVATVYKFFENSLNVSETSRQLFIHRNTLVYRVEKLKSLTGLDVRIFDDALTFMIAMMVYNFLKYLEEENK